MDDCIEDVKEIRKRLSSLIKDMSKTITEPIIDALDQIEEDLDIQFSHCVDAFYAEYTPIFYDRTYSLYEGWKFSRKKKGLELNWETNGSLIPDTHRASPEYIFDLTYEHGQHGGNIDNGLWRRAIWVREINQLIFWEYGDPAKIGIPINKRITEAFNTYVNSDKPDLHFNSFTDDYIDNKIKKYGLQDLF